MKKDIKKLRHINKRGFTLIEMMIVVAIIIILAAVAIPSYLNTTIRAKKSRVAEDFNVLATVLETYRTDWGKYPINGPSIEGIQYCYFGRNSDVNNSAKSLKDFFTPEISGRADAFLNKPENTAITGIVGGVVYMKESTLNDMDNPFDPLMSYEYRVWITGSGSTTYELRAFYKDNDGKYHILARSEDSANLSERIVDANPLTQGG